MATSNRNKRILRWRRARHARGTGERPRLVVNRSNRNIQAQVIDDDKGVVICGASSLSKGVDVKGSDRESAKKVGEEVARRAKEHGVEKVVFDRNGYVYHGRIKSLAEGAREGGLKF